MVIAITFILGQDSLCSSRITLFSVLPSPGFFPAPSKANPCLHTGIHFASRASNKGSKTASLCWGLAAESQGPPALPCPPARHKCHSAAIPPWLPESCPGHWRTHDCTVRVSPASQPAACLPPAQKRLLKDECGRVMLEAFWSHS